MNEDKLGWLRLADKSDLVLTPLHVLQHRDRGIFGESHAIISREAITSVRLSWRRSRGLLVFGTILLVIYAVFAIGPIIAGAAWQQVLTLSSLTISLIEYGALLAAIVVFVWFWFDKLNQIQIMAPTATLEGIPRSYEEADEFCSLLFSELKDQPRVMMKNESDAASGPKAADPDWRL